MKNLKFLAFFFTAALLLASCSSDDDNEPINEEEVITTLTASLTTPDGPTILLTYRDLDGDGPNPPVITVSGSLLPNATYTGSMILLNETESPVEDITEEIKEEDDEHQFFFQVGAGLNIFNVTYLDFDGNGNPLGLNFSFQTGNASQGNFTITLRHEPNKDAAGVSEGNIANAGGETDIAVTFPMVIQ
jgi:hypothetical protein